MSRIFLRISVLCFATLLAAVVCGASEMAEGSREWIAFFIDRSGGCLTLTNTQPALPDGTVRNMKCPECRKEGRLKWAAERPDELVCGGCGATVSERTFPANGELRFEGMAFEYYRDGAGNCFFIKPEIRYIKSIHAMHRARVLARLAKRNRDRELARRALDTMLAYSEYYRKYICNVSGAVIYRPGQPRMCNWGRITHFGDYVIPNWFCATYRDIADSKLEITPEERGIYRSLLEEIISEITLPFIRQFGGMGNPMGAAFADCIQAGRTFPEGRFTDHLAPDASGKARVLNGADLVHEMIEGRHGLEHLLANFWYGDGLMRERTVAYQQMLVRGIGTTAAAIKGYGDPAGYDAAARGYRAFAKTDLLGEPVLKRMLNEHKSISFPDGRSIPIGDDYGDMVCDKPALESTFHAGWGVGALRLGPKERVAAAVLNWGSGLDGHSHNDMLSLLYWGENMLMLNAPEYPAHRADAIREAWWRGGAAAHNTVVIDGVNHSRSRGDAVLWGESPQLAVTQAVSRGAYPEPGTELRRTVMLVDTRPGRTPYLLDVFEAKGGRSHDYFLQAQAPKYGPPETLEILAPELQPSEKPDLAALLEVGKEAGYAYIAAPSSSPLDAAGELRWNFPSPDGAAVLRALLLPDGHETLYCGDAPGVRNVKEKDQGRTVKKIVRRRTGENGLQSRFVSIFESYRAGAAPDPIRAERLPVAGNGVAVRVEHDAGSDLLLLRTGAGELSLRLGHETVSFDGEAALLALKPDGTWRGFTSVGGSRFRFGGREIACGGTVRGRLSDNPAGLNPDLFAEKNAGVAVNTPLPGSCRGKIMFIEQANGAVSGWKIVDVTAAENGSRVEFDRSARNALLEVERLGGDGSTVEYRAEAHVQTGDRVRFGDNDFRSVKSVHVPQTDPPTSMRPMMKVFAMARELPRLTLNRPVGVSQAAPGAKLPVSEIGSGDSFFIPLTVYVEFSADKEKAQ